MLKSLRNGMLAASCLGAMLAPSLAQDIRNETVRFPRGTSGTTIEDSITGYEGVRYKIGVTAGQTMSVELDTDNSSNYFNITAPGASEALYNGSVSGNGTSFRVPSSGDYVIDVYLMRNAARRGETADYDLTLYVENASGQQSAPAQPRPPSQPSSAAPSQLSTAQMPRFCAGEASAEFGVRPQDITVNMAFRSGDRYVTQGNFDRDGDTTFSIAGSRSTAASSR